MNRRSVLKSIFFGYANYQTPIRLAPANTPSDLPRRPVLRSFLMPSYPPLLRQAGSEGRVSVILRISEQGTVESLKDFSGPTLFYDEIEKCLRGWRFEASNVGPTDLPMTFDFRFKGSRDERCLHYQVSGELPNFFIIEVNPFPNVNS